MASNPRVTWSEDITDADGDTLTLSGYDDGDIEVHLTGPSVVLTRALRDKLRELLDRDAIPGQVSYLCCEHCKRDTPHRPGGHRKACPIPECAQGHIEARDDAPAVRVAYPAAVDPAAAEAFGQAIDQLGAQKGATS